MKKVKVLLATLLASSLFLSGCTFEEGMEMAKNWASSNIGQPVSNFWDYYVLGKRPEEEKKEEKEDEGEQPAPVAQLLSISISGQFDDEYEVGESFDASGIVVTAAYDDGSTQDVSSQATFSGFSSEQAGPCTVTVSFGGQSATIELTIVPAVKRAWTSEEEAVFSDHLHGEVLPFLPLEGATPTYDSQKDQVRIFDANGDALAVSGQDVPDYAALFTTADGWEDVSYQYSAYSSAEQGSFWVFEKSIETNEGFRRISVQFFSNDGSSYKLDGSFYLFASDPFSYSFPAEELANTFETYNLDGFTIDAPTKDGLLYFEFYANPYNATYIGYYNAGYFSYDEIHEYIYVTIYLYGLTSAEYEDYIAKLGSTGGWTMTPGSGSNDYNYYGSKQIGELGIAHIKSYDASAYAGIEIELLLEDLPKAEWPTQDIQAFFSDRDYDYYEFPKFEGESVSYKCTEYLYYGYYPYGVQVEVVGATSAEISYYLETTLPQAGWTVDDSSDTIYATKVFASLGGKQAEVALWEEDGSFFMVMFYELTIVSWPADDVAALVQVLAPGSQTVVPAIDTGTSYSFYGSQELDVYGPASLVDDYAAILTSTDNNWVEDSENAGTYISPNQDIALTLDYDTDYNCLMIIFNAYYPPSLDWPTAQIAALFPAGFQDTLPAFEGQANSYQVYTDYGLGVLINVGEGNEEDAIESYSATLTEDAHFTVVDHGDGRLWFRSPNGEFTVEIYKATDGNIGVEVSQFKGFINDEVDAFFEEQGVSYKLPDFSAYEVECNSISYGSYSIKFYFYGDLTTSICNLLAANGFSVPETPSTSYGYECYYSANTDIEIDVKYVESSDYTTVTIYYWG